MKTVKENQSLEGSTRLLPYGMMLLYCVIFGLTDPLAKIIYGYLPVYSVLSVRYLIALAILLAFLGKRIIASLRAHSPKVWLPSAFCVAATFLVGNTAMKFAPATSVAFLRSLSTVITPLLAMVLFRKKLHWRHIPILACVVVGLYLLCGAGGMNSFGLGEGLALVNATLLASSLVFGEYALKQKIDPIALTAAQTGVAALMNTVCAFAFSGGWHLDSATPACWGIILYMAILGTILGFFLQNKSLSMLPSRTVALIQCFLPVMTAVFSWFILGERLTPMGFLGAAIILCCIVAETLVRD